MPVRLQYCIQSCFRINTQVRARVPPMVVFYVAAVSFLASHVLKKFRFCLSNGLMDLFHTYYYTFHT